MQSLRYTTFSVHEKSQKRLQRSQTHTLHIHAQPIAIPFWECTWRRRGGGGGSVSNKALHHTATPETRCLPGSRQQQIRHQLCPRMTPSRQCTIRASRRARGKSGKRGDDKMRGCDDGTHLPAMPNTPLRPERHFLPADMISQVAATVQVAVVGGRQN